MYLEILNLPWCGIAIKLNFFIRFCLVYCCLNHLSIIASNISTVNVFDLLLGTYSMGIKGSLKCGAYFAMNSGLIS